MSKTLIGITSWGNLEFLKLAIEANQKTLNRQADIFVVVAKPGDQEMIDWLTCQNIQFIVHDVNKGFAASVNDIFEHGWVHNGYDNIIIQGNDVIPYPGALDALIDHADTTDWEWLCATQFDSKTLVNLYPEAGKYFEGPNLVFSDFTARPWEMHRDEHPATLEPDAMKDVRNLALFKRSVFDKIGYADVNYWPNAYYEDNDYVRRALNAGIKAAGVRESVYFHFWSRSIFQGEGRPNNVYFQRNEEFFKRKWGGMPGQEKYSKPFKGIRHKLTYGVLLGDPNIHSRANEAKIISYWTNKQ